MQKNMGAADRLIRLFIAAMLALLVYSNQINGPMAIVTIVICAVLFVTAIMGSCPIYQWLGADTRFKKHLKSRK